MRQDQLTTITLHCNIIKAWTRVGHSDFSDLVHWNGKIQSEGTAYNRIIPNELNPNAHLQFEELVLSGHNRPSFPLSAPFVCLHWISSSLNLDNLGLVFVFVIFAFLVVVSMSLQQKLNKEGAFDSLQSRPCI